MLVTPRVGKQKTPRISAKGPLRTSNYNQSYPCDRSEACIDSPETLQRLPHHKSLGKHTRVNLASACYALHELLHPPKAAGMWLQAWNIIHSVLMLRNITKETNKARKSKISKWIAGLTESQKGRSLYWEWTNAFKWLLGVLVLVLFYINFGFVM